MSVHPLVYRAAKIRTTLSLKVLSGDKWTEHACLWNMFNRMLSDDGVGWFLNYRPDWKFPHIAQHQLHSLLSSMNELVSF